MGRNNGKVGDWTLFPNALSCGHTRAMSLNSRTAAGRLLLLNPHPHPFTSGPRAQR